MEVIALAAEPSINLFNVGPNVIAFITRQKVNIVDIEARMVFLGGHPAKYYSLIIEFASVCECVV